MGKAPLITIAAGGTGGHMFPAQSLSEAMLKKGWRVKLSTDARGARFTSGFSHAVAIEEVASATFARGGILAKLAVPFRIGVGVVKAAATMLRNRPAIVVGFGGYPTIPAMTAAWLLRVPRMIHEQNGVLGRVNQIFAKRVNTIACGTWPTELPRGLSGRDIGNPVRASVMQRAGAPYIPPGNHPMSILVTGGSQGAKILSDIVPAAISLLPPEMRKHVRVAHQARAEDVERVVAAYEAAGVSADVQNFFHDIPARFADAQLVIMRSGASSVADLTVIGRPSVLVPLATAIRDEQTANARGLVDAGAAILIPESRLEPQTLAEQIGTVLGNPEAAIEMAHRALAMGKPDATERLVSVVEELAGLDGK